MRQRLERLIGLNWSTNYLLATSQTGPIPGVQIPENNWELLAQHIVTKGAGKWWGKHNGYDWANDEGSQSTGARVLMACLINGVQGAKPLLTQTIFGQWNIWQLECVKTLAVYNGIAPLFWKQIRPELLGVWAVKNCQAFEDNAAIRTLEAYALAYYAFIELGMKANADSYLPVIKMICDRVQYLVNRHGGLAQYHLPANGDIISGRAFEPPRISTRETGDALLMLEIGNVILDDVYDADNIYQKLLSWQLDKNVWHNWINEDHRLGCGVDKAGKIVPASLGSWPVQGSAATTIGVPVSDGAMRQIARYEYSKMS